MEQFEKVEKLRNIAEVSFEEAKEALEASNGDLLDAVVYLERAGKINGPKNESYKVGAENNLQLASAPQYSYGSYGDYMESKKQYQSEKREAFKRNAKNIWKKLNDNFFVASKDDKTIINIPVWIFLLIFFSCLHIVGPAMIVCLFFGFRYRFEGADNLGTINNVMDKASDVAEGIKKDIQ